ncbi:flavin reductase family protein [Lacisediminihabitans changchengi]|uniref:Flavin reductase family protein n=1 Tax=Lacisediminihabitans changchengi TaxID=2787634 RepID=A0A934W450_9MICO|nr:flavin reductase family protein [Lacisediminihabitans changchengi]MBK4346948.1 flavin reductase family protein [Lacisediminihabitans changchengi]MBK4347929.1 flavin reductase family protein [Lacisediminihabitans changchengi]
MSSSSPAPQPQHSPLAQVQSIDEHAGLSATDFKLAFRNHPAGVAVVTADAGDGPVGLTVTSVFSVSAEPPLLVFSISGTSSSAPTLNRADTVVVHLLGADQLQVAKLFATSGVDRFADTSSWSRLVTGEPYLPGAPVWIRGRIINRMVAGSSTVIAVHALQAHISESEAPPLVYHNRTWHHVGEHSRLEG